MAPAEIAATQLEMLVEAACRYRPVMDLLTAVHEIRNGRDPDDDAADLLDAASVAALLARAQRINDGIDRE